MELSNEAREVRREYNRQYYAKHKDAAKERKRRYWERMAQRMIEQKEAQGNKEEKMTMLETPEWETPESIKKLPVIVHTFDINGKRVRVDRFSNLKNAYVWLVANGYVSMFGKQIFKAVPFHVYKASKCTALVLVSNEYKEGSEDGQEDNIG